MTRKQTAVNAVGLFQESESPVTTTSVAISADHRIPVIGIVGGIGSGKTTIANWVAEHANVSVINADELGHQALRATDVKKALCQRFSDQILAADGEIARSALAHRVFGTDASHQAARRDLEQIIHPEIGRRIADAIGDAMAAGNDAVLLDAAVMLEAGWREKCDVVMFIDTPEQVRIARVKEHRGWTLEELRRRESSQWSLTDKRRQSDLIVTNDHDVESAGKQVLAGLKLVNVES